MALGNRIPTVQSALMAAEAQSRPPTEEELRIIAANVEMVRRAKELASAPSEPRMPEQPGPIGARLAEQDALQRRLDEESAVLEMRMRRGEDVGQSLARIEQLSQHVDPNVRPTPPKADVIEPERLAVPYQQGSERPQPLGMARGRDIVQRGEDWI